LIGKLKVHIESYILLVINLCLHVIKLCDYWITKELYALESYGWGSSFESEELPICGEVINM